MVYTNRPQLAAILAADTGLGLQQWELKLFLAAFDLTDQVTAKQFCAIYTYLASRPATPAPAEWAIDNVRVAFDKCRPDGGGDGEVSRDALCAQIEAMDLKDKGPVILATIRKHAGATARWPEIEKLTRKGIKMLRSEMNAPGGPSADAVGAALDKLEAPAARAVAAAGAVFPPDFLLHAGWKGGHVPIEEYQHPAGAGAGAEAAGEAGNEDGKWRAYDGSGQYPALPFLGGAGAPYSLCVKSTHEFKSLPAAADVVRKLHVRSPATGGFQAHPNDVSAVLLAFASLVARELGMGGDDAGGAAAGAGATNGMSSYLDLQMLYGVSVEECAAVREGAAGRIKADAAARRGACGGAAAEALLTVFSRNHNHVAEHVAMRVATGGEDDEKVFQIARHVNILTLRSVFLKDYIPFLGSGAHMSEALTVPPMVKPSTPGQFGVNGCVELDLMLRGLAAMEPEAGLPGGGAPGGGGDGGGDDAVVDVNGALAGASAAKSGWPTRRNIPARLAAAEIAAVERARAAGVCTLNEFRLQMGLHAWSDFKEMTGEPELAAALEELYGDVDNCELYTGLMCEYNVRNGGVMLPHAAHMCSLPLNIVAADKWFSDEVMRDAERHTNWGLEYAAGASLAGLLAQHTQVRLVADKSVFNVGSLLS